MVVLSLGINMILSFWPWLLTRCYPDPRVMLPHITDTSKGGASMALAGGWWDMYVLLKKKKIGIYTYPLPAATLGEGG